MHFLSKGLALLLIGGASAASAQSSDTEGPLPVTGTVPIFCTSGTNGSGSGAFDLGVLIDTTTGLLRNDLSAPPKVLTGAFCSSSSTISISATPLVSVNNVATPRTGLSRSVDFTATASGWTTNAARFTTGAASNPAATQNRGTAFTGDITVAISGFTTTGGDVLLLVADPAYLGSVTVTLAAAN